MPFGKTLRTVCSRLTCISWDELQTRCRQGITKRWEASVFGIVANANGNLPSSLLEAPTRFFFAPSDLPHLIALLRERLPSEANRIIEEAVRICQHRFDLLGYRDLDYGPEIDWHLDLVHGKRAPLKPWFKIRFMDFDEVGDHKITWELNRHQHLVTLAKAYCLTHEERFAAELLRQWYHWQQENPYPLGINWASSLEVAFRSLSWLWVRHLLTYSSAGPAFQLDLLRALALNGRHINRYLSTYYSPNTHLLGEAVALFFIGTLCPQLPGARTWQQRGWEIVLREAERQMRPDGMHFEQSTYYHVYAVDFLIHARTLAALNGLTIPRGFDEKLEKMLHVLCALSQAGLPARFGDDDGGRVFNPRRNRAEQLVDPLATGAVVFGRGDFKAAAPDLREETLWLLGPQGVAQFEQLPASKRSPASTRLEDSGIYVMASSEPPLQQLVIDAGPQGAFTAGHGHTDALSVQLSANGREWLVDPGTLCYISSGPERDLFRGTAAHNTLQVDGLDQADPTGPFSWDSLPTTRTERWVSGKTFDLFVGSHTGYCRLADPVVHRRSIFHLKSRFSVVRDVAVGKGVHQLDLFWHLAPAVLPTGASEKTIELSATDGKRLALLPVEGHGWSQELTQGSVSPVFGKTEPSLVLRFSRQALLPAEFAILLRPAEHALEELGTLEPLEDRTKNSTVRAYRYSGPEEAHYMFFAEGSQGWVLGPWASDAQFLYCGIGPSGKQHWVLCGGSYAEIDRKRVITCRRAVEHCEFVSGDAARHFSCSGGELALCHLSEDALASVKEFLLGEALPNSSERAH
jgi:Heparinase II/III-like protein/Heparinase II/III N-terminus